MEVQNFKYKTKRCADLSDSILGKCSALYSSCYGFWSGKDSHAKDTPISLSPAYYALYRKCPDMYVSLCYHNRTLVGHAFFLRKTLENSKTCTWVTQLVVRSEYRQKHIATRLLQSAWGFSDYYAWGLATTNAITINTLENVTWRQVDPQFILKNLDLIKALCKDIRYVNGKTIIVDENISQVDSEFFPKFQTVDNSLVDENLYVKKLGKIKDGYEWLAFTFQSQLMKYDEKKFNEMLDFSAEQIQDAYGRMKISRHKWAQHTSHEVDYIIENANISPGDQILDLGCGIGRHSIEFAKRGYSTTGVDFSEKNIKTAKKASQGLKTAKWKYCDCRNIRSKKEYDCVICLYDVIGTFRNLEDNLKIIKSINRQLKKGGRAVISVMNMELTSSLAKVFGHVKENPSLLLKLPASNIMQSSGNIFNPDYFVLDSESHLVYRKEQFEQDGFLSCEYVVADYRFRLNEIREYLVSNGFNIVSSKYVQAGHWNDPLDALSPKAKEILIVAEKI